MPVRRLLLVCLLMMGALSMIPSIAGQKKSDGLVREKFVGAWRLVSLETVRPNGEVIYPFYGKRPEGLIVYDRNGWMSVQIASDPPARVPKDSAWEAFLSAPPAEKVAAVEGYYAYFGTWTVDPSNSTVTHHIKQSLRPGERGEEGVRHFVLDGDRLTLSAKTHEMNEDHERRIVWQRVRSDQP